MNIRKIALITIIAMFAVGILCGAAEASHTFKKGGYKMKVTDKQYKALKNAGKYKTVTKTVTKKKVSYTVVEKVKRSYYIDDENGSRVYDVKIFYPSGQLKCSGKAVKLGTYTEEKELVPICAYEWYKDEVTHEDWKVTKTYKVKVKQKKWTGGYQITKKVGTTTSKTYGTKTKKYATVRVYYTAYGASAGKKLIYKNTKKYGKYMGTTMKIVKVHYNPDGSYYCDVAAYAKWKTTKKVKTPVYMTASHDERMGKCIQIQVWTRDGPLY